MKTFKLAIALLIAASFFTTVEFLHHQNHLLVSQLNQAKTELSSTKTELSQAQTDLHIAENKLGYLDNNKTAVQVTAYTKASTSTFANGHSAAYAVPSRVLPENHVVYVALSSTAQHKLHARMNDYIVLIQSRNQHKTIAKFVDITSPSEHRPVVDVLFSNQQQAVMWGRRGDFYAVNISSTNSPFHRVIGNHGTKEKVYPDYRG